MTTKNLYENKTVAQCWETFKAQFDNFEDAFKRQVRVPADVADMVPVEVRQNYCNQLRLVLTKHRIKGETVLDFFSHRYSEWEEGEPLGSYWMEGPKKKASRQKLKEAASK